MSDQMFHEHEDENQVRRSTNAHPAACYGHPLADQRPAFPHQMGGYDGEGSYYEPAADSLIHKTKDRVLKQAGSAQSMTFEGDLLPRADRADPTRENGGDKRGPGAPIVEVSPTMPCSWHDPYSQPDRHGRGKRND